MNKSIIPKYNFIKFLFLNPNYLPYFLPTDRMHPHEPYESYFINEVITNFNM